MERNLIRHLRQLKPAIDIHGKWISFGNPKTAQKSIMGEILDYRQIVASRGFRNWRRVWHELVEPNVDNIFMFTFVRNPWDKVVSAFHFLQKRKTISQDITFQEYVKLHLAVKGANIDKHFRKQLPTILHRRKRIPTMFVGKFENLQKDWAKVAKVLGETEELPHMNKSKHDHYTEYYDDECREIVQKLYQEEIEVLGYEFGS